MSKSKSVTALWREFKRVERAHRKNVRHKNMWERTPSDHYMMLGAFQALAWAIGEYAMRPSVACAPLPRVKRLKA